MAVASRGFAGSQIEVVIFFAKRTLYPDQADHKKFFRIFKGFCKEPSMDKQRPDGAEFVGMAKVRLLRKFVFLRIAKI